MSALAGVYYFDFRSLDPADRDRASVHFPVAPGAETQFHQSPGLLMIASGRPGQQVFEATRFSGNLCAWDGRMDNREELALLAGTSVGRDASAAEIVLALYAHSRVESLGRVLGDWSLALWDAEEYEILLASDYAGVRPLYYRLSTESLYWSSSLSHLALWTASESLDDEWVAQYLAQGSVGDRSPYRGIRSVPPGRALRAGPSRKVVTRFWDIPAGRSVRCAHDREYEEVLLQLFREAVQVRLAEPEPACAELSGGLDSSSVVSMANRLIRDGLAAAGPLATFTYTQHGSIDERYFREMERFCGVKGECLDLQDYPYAAPEQVGEGAPLGWGLRMREISRRMRAIGSNTLLTGRLGDLVMGNWLDDSGHVADYLVKGQFLEGVREAMLWGQALHTPLYSILFRALRATCNGGVCAGGSELSALASAKAEFGDSLTPPLRRLASDLARRRPAGEIWQLAPPGQRNRLWALAQILDDRVLQCPEPLESTCWTHPFAHRPLVEFMMSIPPEVVCRPGEPRRLMRRALAGVLPELVRKRRSKAIYNNAYLGPLRPLAEEMLRDPDNVRVVQRGYVDSRSIRLRLQRLLDGLNCNETQLRCAILLEFWLRDRDTRIPTHRPPRNTLRHNSNRRSWPGTIEPQVDAA